MLKDLPNYKVKDIGMAIVPKEGDDEFWDVYLINLQPKALRNLIVSSKGYGEIDGEFRETSVIRQYFEIVFPNQNILIEPIQKILFNLTNEYWISYQQDGVMYDKKYIFVNGSISDYFLTNVPLLNLKGVLIL